MSEHTAKRARKPLPALLVLFAVAALLPGVAVAGEDDAQAERMQARTQDLEAQDRVVLQPRATEEAGMPESFRIRAAKTERDPAGSEPAHIDCQLPAEEGERENLRILLIPVLTESGDAMTRYRVVTWQEDSGNDDAPRFEAVGRPEELRETSTIVLEPRWHPSSGGHAPRMEDEPQDGAQARELRGFLAIAAKVRGGADPSGEIQRTSKTDDPGSDASSEGKSKEDALVEMQRVELVLPARPDDAQPYAVMIRPQWDEDGGRVVGYSVQLVRKVAGPGE